MAPGAKQVLQVVTHDVSGVHAWMGMVDGMNAADPAPPHMALIKRFFFGPQKLGTVGGECRAVHTRCEATDSTVSGALRRGRGEPEGRQRAVRARRAFPEGLLRVPRHEGQGGELGPQQGRGVSRSRSGESGPSRAAQGPPAGLALLPSHLVLPHPPQQLLPLGVRRRKAGISFPLLALLACAPRLVHGLGGPRCAPARCGALTPTPTNPCATHTQVLHAVELVRGRRPAPGDGGECRRPRGGGASRRSGRGPDAPAPQDFTAGVSEGDIVGVYAHGVPDASAWAAIFRGALTADDNKMHKEAGIVKSFGGPLVASPGKNAWATDAPATVMVIHVFKSLGEYTRGRAGRAED